MGDYQAGRSTRSTFGPSMLIRELKGLCLGVELLKDGQSRLVEERLRRRRMFKGDT